MILPASQHVTPWRVGVRALQRSSGRGNGERPLGLLLQTERRLTPWTTMTMTSRRPVTQARRSCRHCSHWARSAAYPAGPCSTPTSSASRCKCALARPSICRTSTKAFTPRPRSAPSRPRWLARGSWGLDPQATGHALAIATSLAAGYKCQLGTTTIHLHTGLAAHNGILASALAAAGATGASDALDGNWSTLSLLAEIDAPGFEGPLAKLGNPLAIEEYGLYVKPYPCCSYATVAIDGLLALRAEHCITADDVAGITIAIPHREHRGPEVPGSP